MNVTREGLHMHKSGPSSNSLPQVEYPIVREVSSQNNFLVVVEKGYRKGSNCHPLNTGCIGPVKLNGNQVNTGYDLKSHTSIVYISY